MSIGFDVGSYDLICAKRGNGIDIRYKSQINNFKVIENQTEIDKLKSQNIPLIERDNIVYLVGQKENILDSYKRTIVNGILNQKEADSYKVLQNICHGLISPISDRDTLCFSTPAKIVNRDFDVKSQKDLLLGLFKSYKVEGKALSSISINEGLAIVYAELGLKQRTGIGISFGFDLITFCYSIFGSEVKSFSIANDWTKIELIKNVVSIIEKETLDINSKQPLDVVVTGHHAEEKDFTENVKYALLNAKLTFSVGDVWRPDDYRYTVARGCLVAADVSQ